MLLILAGVTIATLTGENGILTRAEDAKTKTEQAQNDEEDILSSYEEKINEYVEIDWNTVFENAKIHPEQKRSTAIGIGTDGKSVNMDLWEYTLLSDDTYVLNDIETINGNTKTSGYSNGNIVDGRIQGTIPQYIKGENDDIFKEVTSLSNTFRSVTNLEEPPIIPPTIKNMVETFIHCNKLNEMPEIPYGVTDMTSTFYNCSNLQNVTNIPNSVNTMVYTFFNCNKITNSPKLSNSLQYMTHCFEGCTELIEMPDIPNEVIYMNGTFWGCSTLKEMKSLPDKVEKLGDCFRDCINLKTASTIPNSVTDMRSTFRGCSNLQGVLEINANLTGKITDSGYADYEYCLEKATTNAGIRLQVIGTCIVIDKIVESGNNPNIFL